MKEQWWQYLYIISEVRLIHSYEIEIVKCEKSESHGKPQNNHKILSICIHPYCNGKADSF